MIWCPYTDSDLDEEATSPEHILPLALGGHDQFVIPVCKQFNSESGRSIDGVLANDPFVLMKRNAFDVRGHSNKKPAFVDRRGRHVPTGEPLHIALDRRDGLKLWSPKEKTEVRWPGPVSLNFKLNIDSGMRFVAKVALAAGYFAYGDPFRTCVKHADFRFVMNTDPANVTEEIPGLTALVDDRFSTSDEPRLQIVRALCRAAVGGSVVCLVPGRDRFLVAVGILGDYMGMVSVESASEGLPRDADFALGHVIAVQNRRVHRLSFRQALEDLASAFNRKSVGSSDTQGMN